MTSETEHGPRGMAVMVGAREYEEKLRIRDFANRLMDKDGIPMELRKQCLQLNPMNREEVLDDDDAVRLVALTVKLETLYQDKARAIERSARGEQLDPHGRMSTHLEVLEAWRARNVERS